MRTRHWLANLVLAAVVGVSALHAGATFAAGNDLIEMFGQRGAMPAEQGDLSANGTHQQLAQPQDLHKVRFTLQEVSRALESLGFVSKGTNGTQS